MIYQRMTWLILPFAMIPSVSAFANDPISLLREFDSNPKDFVKGRIDGLASKLKSASIEACGRVCERGAEVEKAGKLTSSIQSDSVSWLGCAFSKFSIKDSSGGCEPEPVDDLFSSFAGKAKATLKDLVPSGVSSALGQIENAQANIDWASNKMAELSRSGSSLIEFAGGDRSPSAGSPTMGIAKKSNAMPDPLSTYSSGKGANLEALSKLSDSSGYAAKDLRSEFSALDAERERQAEAARLARLEQERLAAEAAARLQQQNQSKAGGGGILGDILTGIALGAGVAVAERAGVPVMDTLGTMARNQASGQSTLMPQFSMPTSGSCQSRVESILNQAQAQQSSSMCRNARLMLQAAIQTRSIAPSCNAEEAASIRTNADNIERGARETIRQICVDG